MERRNFISTALTASAASLAGRAVAAPQSPAAGKGAAEYYELRRYQLLSGPGTKLTDKYLAGALIPAWNELGIGPGVHYLSIPEHPYYRTRYAWEPEQWPHALRLGRQTASLPLSPNLSNVEIERVIDAVRCVLRS